jgi:LemA protein
MMTWLGIILVAAVLAIVLLYNRLVRSRNRVDTAWSDIDVQLQRRHDLIPNIIKTVQASAAYERSTLEAVTELRAQAISMTKRDSSRIAEIGELEDKLISGVQKLIAVAESYPDLKADKSFQRLQSELVETEGGLQFARRYYNGSVRNYNTMTETVPSNLVAGWFSFSQRSFFQKSSDEVGQAPLIKSEELI